MRLKHKEVKALEGVYKLIARMNEEGLCHQKNCNHCPLDGLCDCWMEVYDKEDFVDLVEERINND